MPPTQHIGAVTAVCSIRRPQGRGRLRKLPGLSLGHVAAAFGALSRVAAAAALSRVAAAVWRRRPQSGRIAVVGPGAGAYAGQSWRGCGPDVGHAAAGGDAWGGRVLDARAEPGRAGGHPGDSGRRRRRHGVHAAVRVGRRLGKPGCWGGRGVGRRGGDGGAGAKAAHVGEGGLGAGKCEERGGGMLERRNVTRRWMGLLVPLRRRRHLNAKGSKHPPPNGLLVVTEATGEGHDMGRRRRAGEATGRGGDGQGRRRAGTGRGATWVGQARDVLSMSRMDRRAALLGVPEASRLTAAECLLTGGAAGLPRGVRRSTAALRVPLDWRRREPSWRGTVRAERLQVERRLEARRRAAPASLRGRRAAPASLRGRRAAPASLRGRRASSAPPLARSLPAEPLHFQ
jgi:hypothetical protein